MIALFISSKYKPNNRAMKTACKGCYDSTGLPEMGSAVQGLRI